MEEMRDLDHSRIFCPTCGVFHPAELVEHDHAVFWRIACPKGVREERLSSDATLFRKFRAQARPITDWYRRALTNCIVHINDDCSLQCPICFENAARSGWRISSDEFHGLAAHVRKLKPSNVMFTGGEPTEHPLILEFVRELAKKGGFHCSVLTNGVRLGRERNLAADLKEAGLARVSLSFDTFDPKVSEVMRGRGDLVDLKLKAIENCEAAGLNCGLVTTGCRLSLPEVPKIAAFVIAHAGRMTMYDVQCFQPVGRVVPGLESVDREEIVKTLVASGVVPGLTEDDFRISPSVPAAGYCLHPDCATYLLWLVKDGKAVPIERELPYAEFVAKMEKMKPGPRWLKWSKFLATYVGTFGWRRLGMLRNALGTVEAASTDHLQMFSVSCLQPPTRLDAQRIGRCFSGVLTRKGTVCPPCYYYGCRFDQDRRQRGNCGEREETR